MTNSMTSYFDSLAELCSVERDVIEGYMQDLEKDQVFLNQINSLIEDVPEFGGKQFSDVLEMRIYRVLLYLLTRIHQPASFVETGVHNGMSSAFILLGMQHNDKGHLHSIDLPPVEQRILDQGTNSLPADKTPGWIIPQALRDRHTMHLQYAQTELPRVLAELGEIGIFLHDSDHEYTHIMFEIGLAWGYLERGGLIIIDNIEQNDAFQDFARATRCPNLTVSSFEGPDRTWQHGIVIKADG